MGRPVVSFALALLAVSCTAWAVAVYAPRQAAACGFFGPYDFDTYEIENYTTDYNTAIDLAAEGKAIPFGYTLGTGDAVDVQFQGLKSGPRATRLPEDKARRVPPSVYKSIAWIEANWSNAAGTVPYGGVGPVLRSFDCGYGLGQVTSGMSNSTGNPSARQAIIGTHFLFNIAEGVRILADKWNSAPKFRPIAGNGDPAMLEDWYFAIWSYNGFAFSNHPFNPIRDPLRSGHAASPIYHCYDPKAESYGVDANGVIKFGYGDYTYPERVYGCMRNPPIKNDKQLWAPQYFTMPDFTIPEVGAAFTAERFTACEDKGFSGGCPNMDFPTTIAAHGLAPHPDLTPPGNRALASKFLGDPRFAYTGPASLVLTAYQDGTASSGAITVRNAGTWIAPFRVRVSAPWIVVRHPGETPGRTIDGGVAIGRETDVVTQGKTTSKPRLAQKGYDSQLVITLNPDAMPPGVQQGTVVIEPLLGSGGVFQVTITATKGASSLANRRVVPALSTGQ